jgi:hypothetical protein
MRGQIFAELFLHHRFVIGPISDVHFGDGVAFVDDEVCADSIEEPEADYYLFPCHRILYYREFSRKVHAWKIRLLYLYSNKAT